MKDMISRKAAIDALDKIFPADPMRNDYTQGITCGAALAKEYIKQLPSAQPETHEERTETHSCDCISRQAAINKILGQPPEPHYPSWYAEQIKELPPAESKRAKWERHYSRPGVFADLCWHCSACGYKSSDGWANKFNFCPNCGAEMTEEKE